MIGTSLDSAAAEHIARTLAETTALSGADAHLIVQAALALSGTPATREEMSALLLTFLNPPKHKGEPWTYSPDEAADALLARFMIVPR